MDINIWMIWYRRILEDFGFDPAADMKSAKYINDFLKKHENVRLDMDNLPHDGKFIIFGAGPSIKKHVNFLKENFDLEDFIKIAADGATTALLEESITPDIIVTDLDGDIKDIIRAHKLGSFIVIHGHGNNMDKLKAYLPHFERIFATTQTRPLEYVHNFGGFTDGDRAVFLAIRLGAEMVILAGMDFGNIITRYSRPEMTQETGRADKIKKRKLYYAEKLINWIKGNINVPIYDLSKEEPPIKN